MTLCELLVFQAEPRRLARESRFLGRTYQVYEERGRPRLACLFKFQRILFM